MFVFVFAFVFECDRPLKLNEVIEDDEIELSVRVVDELVWLALLFSLSGLEKLKLKGEAKSSAVAAAAVALVNVNDSRW